MMHVTFNDGEFSAESGAELVVDTLDCFAFSSSIDVNQHGKLVRVWASGSKAPLAKYKHQHAKPARMMPVADLLSLRDGFLKDEWYVIFDSDENHKNQFTNFQATHRSPTIGRCP